MGIILYCLYYKFIDFELKNPFNKKSIITSVIKEDEL